MSVEADEGGGGANHSAIHSNLENLAFGRIIREGVRPLQGQV